MKAPTPLAPRPRIVALAVTLSVTSWVASASAQDAPPAPAPAPDTMQAGGLAPPPPMSDTQAQGNTERDLAEAKKRDSGRGLTWFWLDAQAGFEHVGLQTFTSDPLKLSAGFVPTTSSGAVISGGLGLRLFVLTIGPRARIGFLDQWQLFSLGGEVGVHVPIGRVEPHFDAGFGYAGLGNVSGALSGAPDAISIRGFYARLGAGLDFYVVPALSIGANFSFEMLGLTRPGIDPMTLNQLQASGSITQAQSTALALDGSSYGSAITVTAGAGLHF